MSSKYSENNFVEKKHILITFESVNFAMQTEKVLKSNNIPGQIMPTPRVITLSCGISIRIAEENLNTIIGFVQAKMIRVKNLYYYNMGSPEIIDFQN